MLGKRRSHVLQVDQTWLGGFCAVAMCGSTHVYFLHAGSCTARACASGSDLGFMDLGELWVDLVRDETYVH